MLSKSKNQNKGLIGSTNRIGFVYDTYRYKVCIGNIYKIIKDMIEPHNCKLNTWYYKKIIM